VPWLASVLCQIGLLGLPAPGPREVPADALDATVAAQSEAHAARVAWRQGLAAAHYRRDDPAVEALAEQLTDTLVPRWYDAPFARPELIEALEPIAGRALGPLAESAAYAFLPAFLRSGRGDDLLVAPSHSLRAAEALLPVAPDRAAAHLRDAIGAQLSMHWGAWCTLALALPAAHRDALTDRFVEADPPPLDAHAACQLLRALSPRHRGALVRQLRDDPTGALPDHRTATVPAGASLGLRHPWGDPTPVWPLVAAVGLHGTAHAAFAADLLRRALAPERMTPDRWARLGDALGTALPALPLDDAPVGRALRVVVEAPDNTAVAPLAPVLLARGDAWAALWARRVLQGPLGREGELPAALLLAGALTADTSADRQALDNVLGSLRATLGPYALRRVTAAQVDLWREALPRVAACTQPACLYALLREGSDEAAARAAARLGGDGLAALPAEVAHAVVARVVETPGESALATVVFTRLRGCPAAFRGLLSYRREVGLLAREPRPPLHRWRERLARRCAARAP
jgi:hypothetical protein